MFSKKTICAGSCSFNGMRVQSSTLYRFVPAPPYRLGQKSRRDRDWESHNPPNRGCRGLGWV